jgi:methylglutaconyl-CoA hydratase
MTAAEKVVLFEQRADGVAVVTLNRPAVHNAFNDELVQSLARMWGQLAEAKEIRAVLLRGAGANFSGGGDLDYMRKAGAASAEANHAATLAMAKMLRAMRTLPVPVIALVQGACMAGATGLVAAADIALATESSRFGFSEVRLGLTPATISPYVIAAIGERQARRYFLTGERFDAAAARAIGLVHETVPDEAALAARGEAFVAMILQGAPGAIADCKALIGEVAGRQVDGAIMESTARQIARRMASVEGQEGLAAFFAKRKPDWSR